MNITCRGCKKDGGTDDGVGPVQDYQDRSGFIWVPTDDGGSLWLCHKCAEQLLGFAKGMADLVGDLYVYPPRLQGMLHRELTKGSKK